MALDPCAGNQLRCPQTRLPNFNLLMTVESLALSVKFSSRIIITQCDQPQSLSLSLSLGNATLCVSAWMCVCARVRACVCVCVCVLARVPQYYGAFDPTSSPDSTYYKRQQHPDEKIDCCAGVKRRQTNHAITKRRALAVGDMTARVQRLCLLAKLSAHRVTSRRSPKPKLQESIDMLPRWTSILQHVKRST